MCKLVSWCCVSCCKQRCSAGSLHVLLTVCLLQLVGGLRLWV